MLLEGYWDQKKILQSVIREECEEAEARAEARAESRGMVKNHIKVVLHMKEVGFSEEDIAKATETTVEEVKEILMKN